MYGLSRRVALTAFAFFGVLRAPVAHAQVFCRSIAQCKQPDSMTVLLRPQTNEVILDANFGLVYQSPQGGWLYTCDDIFGERIQYRAQITADGRVFVPAIDGLYVGSQGCGFDRLAKEFIGETVHDISFDPTNSVGSPDRIWALSGDPRKISLSTDGGKTFVLKRTFPEHLRFLRVQVAPSDPRVIYLAGFNGTQMPLVLAVSNDGGETWTTNETASEGVATRSQLVEFLGVAPDDPQTMFVLVTSGQGDEVWRSRQQGRGLVKVLTQADQEQWPRGGFSFGATGKTLYLAGFDPLNTDTRPPASLYISRDGGDTWERRTSGGLGPRYRCIAHRGGMLYACGGDSLSGDQFLLGVSADEGQTWSPVVRTSDVRGPNECIGDRCAGTVDFLRSFADGGMPIVGLPEPPSGLPEPPRPPPPVKPSSGCSHGGSAPPLLPAALAIALTALRRRRRR
jgi:uncharacterized protein (TIGR03382 family)